MGEIDTDKTAGALEIVAGPGYTFNLASVITKAAEGGEKHWNFHATYRPNEESPSDKPDNAQMSYTVILNRDTGNVYLQKTEFDAKGEPIKGQINQTVGAFKDLAAFNEALDKADTTEPDKSIEALHNIDSLELVKTGHGVEGQASPAVETKTGR